MSEQTVRHSSLREFQRCFCEHFDRSFNAETGTIFAHSKITLRKWLFSICAVLRFHTYLGNPQVETDVDARTIHRRVKSARIYNDDKPPVFTILDRRTGQ